MKIQNSLFIKRMKTNSLTVVNKEGKKNILKLEIVIKEVIETSVWKKCKM